MVSVSGSLPKQTATRWVCEYFLGEAVYSLALILAHLIRLYPNNVQSSTLTRAAGTARFAWNWGLARWNEQYAAGGKPSWMKLDAEMNALKKSSFSWMNEAVGSRPAKAALKDLGQAFQNFFRRAKAGEKPGYPKFKKRGRCKESFYVSGERLQFEGKKIRLPKLGWVKMAEVVRFPGRIRSARFSKRAGNWFVSVQVELAESWSYSHCCENQAVVGVDLGVRNLAVPSKGDPTPAPRALRFYEKRLKRLQREMARRTRGGANWNKTKLKLQKCHEKIANIRRDVTHKLTSGLVKNFRFIGVEDLNIKGMVKNHHLAKSVADAAMAEVRRQLEYKAPLAGGVVVLADRWFPSTKTCSACGHVLEHLALSERQWRCPSCETTHDRDFNAARNLERIAAEYAVKARRAGGSGDFGRETVLVEAGTERLATA